MDESLKDFVYLEILGEAPLYSQEDLAQLEQRVACEVESLDNFLSLDLPCASEGLSTYALPTCTYSDPVPFADAPPAGTGNKQSEKKRLQEPNNEPTGIKPRGQGCKRKAEDENVPNKRQRPAVSSANPANLPNMPNLANLASDTTSFNPVPLPLPKIPEFVYQYTTAVYSDPVSFADAPPAGTGNKQSEKKQLQEPNKEPTGIKPRGQGCKRKAEGENAPDKWHHPAVSSANPANLPNMPNLANLATDTSSFNPVPLPLPMIPEFVYQYTTVVSVEQREKYVRDFMAANEECNFIYAQIGGYLQHFYFRGEKLQFLVPGTEQYQMMYDLARREYLDVVQHHPSYPQECTRYFYLQGIQSHITRLVSDFDRSYGQSAT